MADFRDPFQVVFTLSLSPTSAVRRKLVLLLQVSQNGVTIARIWSSLSKAPEVFCTP